MSLTSLELRKARQQGNGFNIFLIPRSKSGAYFVSGDLDRTGKK